MCVELPHNSLDMFLYTFEGTSTQILGVSAISQSICAAILILEKNQNFFTENSWDLKIGVQSTYTPIQIIMPKWGCVPHPVSSYIQ